MEKYFHFISLINALIAFTTIYLVVKPRLDALGKRRHLMILTGIHLFRYIGLTLMLPHLFNYEAANVPKYVAVMAAYWDFLNGITALIAFVALWKEKSWALAAVWIFNIIACLDYTIGGGQMFPYLLDSSKIDALAWLLIAIYFPALLVSSVAIFFVSLKGTEV